MENAKKTGREHLIPIEKRPAITGFIAFLFSSYNILSGSSNGSGIPFSEILKYSDHIGCVQPDTFIELIMLVDKKVTEMQNKKMEREIKLSAKKK